MNALRLALATLAVLPACAECVLDPSPPSTEVRRREALDRAFHAEPRWLGGDAAYTIDLGGDRTLWLFGDSFIATSGNLRRDESTMVRNSVAVMTGRDLRTATLEFAWRDGSPPTSFFPEQTDRWFWPGDGVRTAKGTLLVFLSEIRATPGEGLGFAGEGFRAVRIPDPAGDPLGWSLEPTSVRAPAFAPRSNVACSAVEGGHLIALVTDDDAHDAYLARWRLSAIDAGEDLADPEWWTGTRWQREGTSTPPAVVIPAIATECSLHRDPGAGWMVVWSRGFGATTIAMRSAPEITGPWSAPADIFTPPESTTPDAFVYAAKAHATLRGPDGGYVITYADNSFTFSDLFDATRSSVLYWPHVAELSIAPPEC